MRRCLSLGLSALVLAASAPAVAKPAGQVALTFDDLPGLTLFADQPYIDYFNIMLLRGLKKHHFPAIGFVNESKLDDVVRAKQIANLQRWLDAGMDLGNHTFSHESPNELGAAGYIDDIAKGEPVTKGLLAAKGKKMQWFRHPYLETGFPIAAKREIDSWLGQHGYRVAPVTIDADDWEFAEPYDDAISRKDEARVKRIREQYLAYTERTIEWYQKASQDVLGRQIAFVMLLHDTRLNADSIDDLAAILKRHNLKPVSLEKAMKDPAYKKGDTYPGKDGIDWIERWADEMHKNMPWSTWQDPPKQIEQEYDRFNRDRH